MADQGPEGHDKPETGWPAALPPGIPATAPSPGLTDTFSRVVRNLRISITDRCNLRCVYCMPEFPDWMAQEGILSYEEIHRLTSIFVRLGVEKIRITGGEPTVRRDLPTLVRLLSALPGLRRIGLTTNGILLSELAPRLREAGLQRINISLDSLDRERFREMTRRDSLHQVLRGIDAAIEVKFSPIKLNCVVMRGVNEDEVVPFVEFGRARGLEVRFIEFMPLDADDVWERRKVVSKAEILAAVAAVHPFEVDSDEDPSAPADRYRFLDGGGAFGVIGSVSEPFCSLCDRVRMTADGKLRTCLFALHETDLKTPLRDGASDEEIAQHIVHAVRRKQRGHAIDQAEFTKPERTMHRIGG
jgi:cyclic pyranopterin phosphate synthase